MPEVWPITSPLSRVQAAQVAPGSFHEDSTREEVEEKKSREEERR
jgi:hypothetical protein